MRDTRALTAALRGESVRDDVVIAFDHVRDCGGSSQVVTKLCKREPMPAVIACENQPFELCQLQGVGLTCQSKSSVWVRGQWRSHARGILLGNRSPSQASRTGTAAISAHGISARHEGKIRR